MATQELAWVVTMVLGKFASGVLLIVNPEHLSLLCSSYKSILTIRFGAESDIISAFYLIATSYFCR